MIDKPFFPFTLNRKHLTRTRMYLHFGAEQDLQNWWHFFGISLTWVDVSKVMSKMHTDLSRLSQTSRPK